MRWKLAKLRWRAQVAPAASSDARSPIAELLAAGDTKQALKTLERERARAARAEDLHALSGILALGQELAGRAAGDHRSRAEQVAAATRQNIRFVTRKQALARGESWLDPFAPARPEPEFGPPPTAPAPSRQPPMLLALVGVLIASVAAGALAFVVILTLAVLGGGDYTGPKSGGHYLYPHTFQVILVIGAAVSATGVAVVTIWWLERAVRVRRLAIGLPLAALAWHRLQA